MEHHNTFKFELVIEEQHHEIERCKIKDMLHFVVKNRKQSGGFGLCYFDFEKSPVCITNDEELDEVINEAIIEECFKIIIYVVDMDDSSFLHSHGLFLDNAHNDEIQNDTELFEDVGQFKDSVLIKISQLCDQSDVTNLQSFDPLPDLRKSHSSDAYLGIKERAMINELEGNNMSSSPQKPLRKKDLSKLNLHEIESIADSLNEDNKWRLKAANELVFNEEICEVIERGHYPCLSCKGSSQQDLFYCSICNNARVIPFSEQGLLLKGYILYMVAEFEKKAEEQLKISSMKKSSALYHGKTKPIRKLSHGLEEDLPEVHEDEFDDSKDNSDFEDRVLKKAGKLKGRQIKANKRGAKDLNTRTINQCKLNASKRNLFGENELTNMEKHFPKPASLYDYQKTNSNSGTNQQSYQISAIPKLGVQQSNQDKIEMIQRTLDELPNLAEPKDLDISYHKRRSDLSIMLKTNPNSVCDGCNTSPIIGTMYTCEDCGDYDLCENCYDNKNYTHDETHTFKTNAEESLVLEPDRNLTRSSLIDSRHTIGYSLMATCSSMISDGTVLLEVLVSNKSKQQFPTDTKVVGISEEIRGLSYTIGEVNPGCSELVNIKLNNSVLGDLRKKVHLHFEIRSNKDEFCMKEFVIGIEKDLFGKILVDTAILGESNNNRRAPVKRNVENLLSGLCSGKGIFGGLFATKR